MLTKTYVDSQEIREVGQDDFQLKMFKDQATV